MNKNTGVIVGIVVLVVLGGLAFVMNSSNQKAETMVKEDMVSKDMVMKHNATKTEDMIDKKDEMIKDTVKTETMVKGSYEAYMPEKLAKAETGDVVLFFHASWCPSCRALNSDIESNRSSIPNNVHILNLDYDKETELKKKYGVTSQHTLVQVDKDGNMIQKWSGGSKLTNVVSQIK